MSGPMPQSFWDSPEEQQAHEEAVKKASDAAKPQAVATSTRPDPVADVRRGIKAMEEEFAKVLPSHIRPEQYARIIVTTLQMNPALLNYDRTSLFAACMLAAQDGLMPDGKEAALTPFKGKVKYSPMVWGIMKKIRQSGDLSTLTVNMVFKNDKFRYWVDDDGEHVEHEPPAFAERGPKIGGYAMMKFRDGGRQIELMSMSQIKDVENVSQAGNGPWKSAFKEEMEKKTIVRRLSKRCPMSPEAERVVRRDDDLYDFKEQASERGLAKELNGGEKSGDASGDKIGSLSDLQESPGGCVPHSNQEGDSVERRGKPSSDVQASPSEAAPDRVEKVPSGVSGSRNYNSREGMGDKSTPVRRKQNNADASVLTK